MKRLVFSVLVLVFSSLGLHSIAKRLDLEVRDGIPLAGEGSGGGNGGGRDGVNRS